MLRPQGFIVPIVPHNIRHRALHLLFGSPDGCTTRVLLMHGITFDMLADMVESGMVTIERKSVVGDATVRITEAGRQGLARVGRSRSTASLRPRRPT